MKVHTFCADQLDIGVRGEICIFALKNMSELNLAIRERKNSERTRANQKKDEDEKDKKR